VTAGIDHRFLDVLSDKEHLISTVLHPQFKLNFLPEDARLNTKRTVLAYVQQVADESRDYRTDGQQTLTAGKVSKQPFISM